MNVKNYRELRVWQRSMELVIAVCRETAAFPKTETYGLSTQLHRAAVSIPSNIAEGQGRRSTKEFLNHLSLSRGSLMELQTQLEIARRLGYCSAERTDVFHTLATSTAQLLNALIRALERKV